MTLLALPAVALLVLGAALSVAGIGLPLLLAAASLCRWLVRLDRTAANRWLDAQIPPIAGRVRTHGGCLPAVAGPALRPRRCGGWRPT